MPSPRVLDLSPTYNKGLVDFGDSFTRALEQQDTNARDQQILEGIEGYSQEQDPLKKLNLLENNHRLSPQRRKQERQELIEKAELIRLQEKQDDTISSAKGKDKIAYIDKFYGEGLKQAASALNAARKNPLSEDVPRLEAEYKKMYAQWQNAMQEHAPKGTFDDYQGDLNPSQFNEQPQTPQEPEAPAEYIGHMSMEPVTPDKFPEYVSAAKQHFADDPKTLKEQLGIYVDEAYPDEVPAKKERLVQQAIKGRELKPTPKEIKELKDKDERQLAVEYGKNKQREFVDKTLKELSDPANYPKYIKKGTQKADGLIDQVMKAFGMSEEEAISHVLTNMDFEYVNEKEQEELFDYWEGYTDTERQAVTNTLDELMSLNYKRFATQKIKK